MKLLNRIKMFFGVKVGPQNKYPELSFEPINIGDKTFFHFTDDTLLPVFRAMAYINYRQMMDNRISNKDVEFFCDMIEKQLKSFTKAIKDGQTISGIIETTGKINSICGALREKNKWALNTDIVYQLASIIFIEEDENPHEYIEKNQEAKIKHFKEHGQYFFYYLPVKKLLPPSITSHELYDIFIQELIAEEKKLTDFLTQIQS